MKTYFTDSPMEKQMMRIPKSPKKAYSKFENKAFSNKFHKKTFENEISHYLKQGYILSNRFTAALFILTSDWVIWSHSKYHIKPNYIDFDSIEIPQTDTKIYTRIQSAKDMVFRSNLVSIADLCERSLVSNETFIVLLSAVYISRYGLNFLEES